jgi:hypothetical protein
VEFSVTVSGRAAMACPHEKYNIPCPENPLNRGLF